MDLDVVPIGEVTGDRAVAFAVIGLEGVERLVGEHHPEPERVVRPVALEYGDARGRPRLLQQDREIEAGRAGADHVHLHARLHPEPPPSVRASTGIILGLRYPADKLEA
jgi:hypothetical protein